MSLTPGRSKMTEGLRPSSGQFLPDVWSRALVIYRAWLHEPYPGHGDAARLDPLVHHVQHRAGGLEVLDRGMHLEGAAAVNPDRPPHSHGFDEVFVFLGSNREDPDDLGGEVEFWLGEGKDTEKYLFTTSTCIFVPKGLVHLPMIFKKIKRPFLLVTFGVNMGKEWVRAKAPRK